MNNTLGIDVGGTAIKYGLVAPDGLLTQAGTLPTPQDDPEAQSLVPLIARIAGDFEGEIQAIGVAVPGLVSPAGVAEFSGTLGFRQLPLASLIQPHVSVPVWLFHDVTAAGVAEAEIGFAKDADSAVVFQIGTGIAASIILQGEVYHPHSSVGEVGHTPSAYPRPCPCGLVGCVEMTASGGAIKRNYRDLSGVETSAAEVYQRALQGEAHARRIIDEFVDALSSSIAWVAAIIGPEIVVLSGGVATAGDSLVGELNSHLDRKLSFHRRPRIVVSDAYETRGCVGAGLSAWQRL